MAIFQVIQHCAECPHGITIWPIPTNLFEQYTFVQFLPWPFLMQIRLLRCLSEKWSTTIKVFPIYWKRLNDILFREGVSKKIQIENCLNDQNVIFFYFSDANPNK